MNWAGDLFVGLVLVAAGGCLTMFGFAIRRALEERDAQRDRIDNQALLLTQLESSLEQVQHGQRAYAAHARELAEVRVTVGRLDERSQHADRYMRALAQQGKQTQAMVMRLLQQQADAPGAAVARAAAAH